MNNGGKSGIFINKKTSSPPPAPGGGLGTMLNSAKPKDVKKRWLYVGGAAAVVVIAASSFMNSGSNQPSRPSQQQGPTGMVNVNPPNAEKQAFESRFARDLEQLKLAHERLRAEVDAKDRRIEALTAQNSSRPVPPGITPPPGQLGSNTGGLDALAPPSPPIPPIRPTAPATGAPSAPALPPGIPATGLPPTLAPSSGPMVFPAPGDENKSSTPGASASSSGDVTARTRYQRNPNAGMLPAGSFAPVALLNGLDAGTSAATQANPMPILINVTDRATLPGAARYQLRSCFLLGTAYGDLSAERVYARVSRLSCVDRKDRLVLSQEVQGYLVDSDGKLGMRGVVTDRQGAKLAKSTLAGFAQGLTGVLGQAQGQVLSANAGEGISATQALRASGLSGAQNAMNQLAEFYLKEAQSIFPVITVDAGRTGTVVFTNSVTLSFNDVDNQFVPQVTPVNN